MSSSVREAQKIGRLTPLKDVLARIADQVSPVAVRNVALSDAIGRVLAADVVAPANYPPTAVALRDGYAVRADDTADASAYAPVPLVNATAVQAGDMLPLNADAVVPPDGVTDVGGIAAVVPVASGDGVVAAGADAQRGKMLIGAGRRLRQIDIAALQALGVKSVAVHVPRVQVVEARASDTILASIARFAERLVSAAGGDVMSVSTGNLQAALSGGNADLIIVVGGSGMGERDASIATLQGAGHLHFHGIGIAPGETSALGFVDTMPVLVVPGRIDAAFASLVTVGDPLMKRLSGCVEDAPAVPAVLERKVVSTLGLVEIVPMRLSGARAESLASGYLLMQAMMQADGYVVVPAESEGFPAGSTVAVRMMP